MDNYGAVYSGRESGSQLDRQFRRVRIRTAAPSNEAKSVLITRLPHRGTGAAGPRAAICNFPFTDMWKMRLMHIHLLRLMTWKLLTLLQKGLSWGGEPEFGNIFEKLFQSHPDKDIHGRGQRRRKRFWMRARESHWQKSGGTLQWTRFGAAERAFSGEKFELFDSAR